MQADNQEDLITQHIFMYNVYLYMLGKIPNLAELDALYMAND